MSKKVFFPNLDGLRFFAFLAVFFAHSFYTEIDAIKETPLWNFCYTLARNGVYGVNFFFVLSGFLITYLFLDEKDKTKTVDVKAFYIRRVLRIWPLFYAVIVVGFVIIPNLMHAIGEPYEEKSNIFTYFFFINNLFPVPATAVLGVLWSVAIEEQFYLFWPLIMFFTPAKRYPRVFFSLILLSFVFAIFYPGHPEHTLYCISDLVLGSWLAYLAFNKSPLIDKIASIPKWSTLLIYIAGFAMIITHRSWNNEYFNPFLRILFGMFFAFIIIDQNYGKHSVMKMSKSRFVTFWGKYTYGLYMTHFMVIYFIGKIMRTYYTKSLFDVLIVETVITFVFSLVVAYVSYTWFESPFLKLKEKFAYYRGTGDGGRGTDYRGSGDEGRGTGGVG